MKSEIRVLTSDVANPEYDRRHKYGVKALAKIAKGTRIMLHRTPEKVLDREVVVLSFDILKGDGRKEQSVHDHKLALAVEAASEPAQIATFSEFAHQQGANPAYMAQRIIERMWTQGGAESREIIENWFNAEMARIANEEEQG